MAHYVICDNKCFDEGMTKANIEKELQKKEDAIPTKGTAFNKNFGNTADTVCQGNDSRLSDARTPTAHTHDDRYFTETECNRYFINKETEIITVNGTLKGSSQATSSTIMISLPSGWNGTNCTVLGCGIIKQSGSSYFYNNFSGISHQVLISVSIPTNGNRLAVSITGLEGEKMMDMDYYCRVTLMKITVG